MRALRAGATELGVVIPTDPDFAASGIALALAVGAWMLAWFAGRKLAPHLTALWEKQIGERSEGIAARMGEVIRYGTAAILTGMALQAWRWPDLGSLILGAALGGAVALLIVTVVRGLEGSHWIAAFLGALVFVIVLTDAAGGLTPITEVLDRVGFTIGERRFSLLTVLQIGITILALYGVVKLINRFVGHSLRHASGLDSTQRLLAQKLVAIAVLIAAFFIGIDLVGIDLTALAVFSGALGLAVGFGLQKTFGNLIAGIILLMDRSIKPGDVISVGQSFGSVNKIGVRAVSIVTREGKEHLIPNEILMTEEVVNWSYSTRDVRISIPVGIAYDCDLELAQRLMLEAASQSTRVLANPKPNVWLTAFGESSVSHEIRVWISDPEAGVASVRSEILGRLWHLFREHDIRLPFPQRDIRIKEWAGRAMPGSSGPQEPGEADERQV